MSQALRVVRSWAALLAALTCAASLRAQEPEAPAPAVRLEYSAPPDCPDADGFAAEVRRRTPRVRFAESDELARTFAVNVAAEGAGFRGSLEFLDDAGGIVSRRLNGEQCEAVVSSLALITALALDAALRATEPDPPPAPAPSPAARTPTPAQSSLPVPTPAPPAVTKLEKRRSRARVGLLGGYGSALRGPRIGLLGQLEWPNRLAVRLTAHYDWHEIDAGPGRRARFRRPGLEASLCPVQFRASAFGVAPCLALDFGALRGSGAPSETLGSVHANTIWWASVGAQIRAVWEPALPIWVELGGGFELPLRAGYRFTFENPLVVAYEVPRLAGAATIGGGVRFW